MKERKKRKECPPPQESPKTDYTPRNRPLHIPLDFEQAVDALLNTRPKKKKAPEK